MAMNWGPTVGANTAAERYDRDVNQRGGEVNYSGWESAPTTVAANAAGGRNDRDYDSRLGSVTYTYDANGQPVAGYNANSRNEAEYVDGAGASALAAVHGTDAI